MCEAYKAYFAVPVGNQDKLLLETLNYNKYGWVVTGDFKMEAFLKKKEGFTMNSCFPCVWDNKRQSNPLPEKAMACKN